jgi:mRNA interferase RelE/StbE
MSSDAKHYHVQVLRDPQKILDRLLRNVRRRIEDALDALGRNPRMHGYIRLKGYDDLYRIRVGDWRIIYAIEDAQLVVLVIEIGPRGGIYQGL